MLLSVFTRHSSDCKYAGDRTYRRCNCPKWIGGQVNREYFRKRPATRQWNEAEEYRLKLEDALVKGLPPFGPEPESTQPESLLAIASVSATAGGPALLVEQRPSGNHRGQGGEGEGDGRSGHCSIPGRCPQPGARVLDPFKTRGHLPQAASRLDQGSGTHLDQIDLDALRSFRSTWADGRLAKQTKQSHMIGFFWAGVRRGYIAQNPSMGLREIKVLQIPTDYFPRDEFQRILDATYIYGDPRGGVIDVQAIRSKLRTMTLLMRWSGLRIRDAVTLERDRFAPEPKNVPRGTICAPPGPWTPLFSSNRSYGVWR